MGFFKIALVFGSGYLLGSRAGRERSLQLWERGRALLRRRQAPGPSATTPTDIDDLTEAELDALTAPDGPTDDTPSAR